MYRMLIVDDEKLLLDGLYELFLEHEGHRLELYKASGGLEALSVMSEKRIDILMSDIKMPKMTGLELGDRVKQSWPECRLIFLTGFDEFNYIHHAIKHGAQNYILKSEGDKAILAAVGQTISELDDRLETESILKQAREIQRQQAVHHRSLFLTDLLDGLQLTDELAGGTLESLGIRLAADRPLIMAAARMDLATDFLRISEKELMFTALQSLCGRFLSAHMNCMDVIYNREYLLLFMQPNEHALPSKERIMTFLHGSIEIIQQTAEKSMGRSFSFAFTDKAVEWDGVPRQFTVLKALLSRYYDGIQIIVTDKNLPRAGVQDDGEIRGFIEIFHKKTNALEMYLESGRREEVLAILKELKSYADWPAIDEMRYAELYCAVSLRLLSASNKFGLDKDPGTAPHMAILLQPTSFSTRMEGIRALELIVDLLQNYHSAQSSRLRGDVLGTVNAYIDSHLDGDLSVTKLAQQVYLNPDYLSRMFKQAKGITITEYIAILKIQKAKKLLSEPQLLVQDIAKILGFASAGYFSRFFKKETGQTPQEYKAR